MSAVRPKSTKDRHQEILDAAAHVITERGLAETRISDVADVAGVSPGLILYYFDSKDRLLAEALTYANDDFFVRMSREIRRLPTAREQLRRVIDLSVPGYLPEYGKLDEWALWMEVWVRALRDPQMAKDREILDQRWRQSIADIIRAGQAAGEFPPRDADEIALRPWRKRPRRSGRCGRRRSRRRRRCWPWKLPPSTMSREASYPDV